MGRRKQDVACWKGIIVALVSAGCNAIVEQPWLDRAQRESSEIAVAGVGWAGPSGGVVATGHDTKGQHYGPRCDQGHVGAGDGGIDGAGGSANDAGLNTPDGASPGDGAVGGTLALTPAQLSQDWRTDAGQVSFDADGTLRWSVAFPPTGEAAILFAELAPQTDWSGYATLAAFLSVQSSAPSVQSVQLGVRGGADGLFTLISDESDPSVNELFLNLLDNPPAVSPVLEVMVLLNPFLGTTTPTVLQLRGLELHP